MMFYLGFFVGWVIGIFSAVMLVYLVRRETEQVADGDKVIAELQEKLKVQTSIAEEGWKEFRTYYSSHAEAVKELYEKNKELRYQKYKRCLTMAKLCHWKMVVFIYKKEKSDFYYRWHKRWMKLAEKFKEEK